MEFGQGTDTPNKTKNSLCVCGDGSAICPDLYKHFDDHFNPKSLN